jgi:hypothetical protein
MDQAFILCLSGIIKFRGIIMDSATLMFYLAGISVFGVLLFVTKDCWHRKIKIKEDILKPLPIANPLRLLKIPLKKVDVI